MRGSSVLCPCCKDELFGLRRTHRLADSKQLMTGQHGITPLIFKSVLHLQYREITPIRTTARQLPPRVLEHLILSAATGFSKPVPANRGVTIIRAVTEKLQRCKNWHASSRKSYIFTRTWNLPHLHHPVTDFEGANSPDYSRITLLECLDNEEKRVSRTTRHSNLVIFRPTIWDT